MSTPICDFVRKYSSSDPVRLHMPGHKGQPLLGFEPLDITEIDGADELFAADGIIAESEANASEIFGSRTFYSAGGSTLCIQAMLHLLALNSSVGEPFIIAGRNAHKAFVNAAALLGIGIRWIFPPSGGSYHRCAVTPEAVKAALSACRAKPAAVYLTSPDYLGNILDIKGIAEVCHKAGVPLAVDNAHGAYLKFLPESLHPIDLGADICCDSAHKTLPVITGGAYLHISNSAPPLFAERAKASLSLFGSSSPSYLILQSLDAANDRMAEFKRSLCEFLPKVEGLKGDAARCGYELVGTEPLKLTVAPKSYGYTGDGLAAILRESGIFAEFHDPDMLVLMLSPLCGDGTLEKLRAALLAVERKAPITETPPPVPSPKWALTPREAIFAQSEIIPVDRSLGRVSAAAAISCPPAVPIAVCGEMIDECVVRNFKYYGIEKCAVIK